MDKKISFVISAFFSNKFLENFIEINRLLKWYNNLYLIILQIDDVLLLRRQAILIHFYKTYDNNNSFYLLVKEER